MTTPHLDLGARPTRAAAIALITLTIGAGACAPEESVEPTEAVAHQLAELPTAPTDVRVDPPTIAPHQRFTVRWTPSTASDTLYRVEVRGPANAGSALIWTSPYFTGQQVTYDGPSLQPQGLYQVVVVARLGNTEARSAISTVQVVELFPGKPNTSALPAWAQPLIGTYAVRTETFAQSPIGPMLADRRISLAEFVELPGGEVELRTRLCSKEAAALGLTVYIRDPSAYPEERQRVVLESGGWRTEPQPLANGYERATYAGCSGRIGQRVPRRPEQTWLRTGTCLCNGPAEALTYDDCRVTDPDHDGAPGLAYKYRGSADAETWVAHSATVSRSHYTRGTIDNTGPGAHFGAIKADETTFQLACEPGTCNVSAVVRPCTDEYNGAQFRRLSTVVPFQANVTCEDVVAQAMMQRPALPTPSRCTRDGAPNPLP